jgi:hypothetical protein
MDVYVVPVGRDRYELYYESSAPAAAAEPDDGSVGWFGRLRTRFSSMIREAEAREAAGTVEDESIGWADRLQARLLGWVAERIAEQRLLWNMRRETAARLVHPGDLTFDQALTLLKRILRRDHDRHRIWLVVNGLLLLLSAVLAIVPGPNIVAYYFAFRFVGHWLSMRGAAQGLHHLAWSGEANARLNDLRGAVALRAGARDAALASIAADLGLPNLAAFVDRVAAQ